MFGILTKVLLKKKFLKKQKRAGTDNFSRGNMVKGWQALNGTVQTGNMLKNDVLS